MPEPLEFAQDIARQAGQVLLGLYNQPHTVRHKSSDIDVVTEADLASEELIVGAIRRAFPDHRILSEEGLGALDDRLPLREAPGNLPAERPYLWLVDPLDGTVNYAHGFPSWGLSLALAHADSVVMAVTYDPLLEETYWSERGRGAWLNGRPIHVSDVSTLRRALVGTGFAYGRAKMADKNLGPFASVVPRVQGVRRAGAAVLDLAYLAAGRLDGYWEFHLSPWDWAAGWLLVEEAGGMVTDVAGHPCALGSNSLLASNGTLHAELQHLLASPSHGPASQQSAL